MTAKHVARRVRKSMNGNFRRSFKVIVKSQAGLGGVHQSVVIVPKGRKRDNKVHAHADWATLAGNIFPVLRENGYKVVMEGATSDYANPYILIQVH